VVPVAVPETPVVATISQDAAARANVQPMSIVGNNLSQLKQKPKVVTPVSPPVETPVIATAADEARARAIV